MRRSEAMSAGERDVTTLLRPNPMATDIVPEEQPAAASSATSDRAWRDRSRGLVARTTAAGRRAAIQIQDVQPDSVEPQEAAPFDAQPALQPDHTPAQPSEIRPDPLPAANTGTPADTLADTRTTPKAADPAVAERQRQAALLVGGALALTALAGALLWSWPGAALGCLAVLVAAAAGWTLPAPHVMRLYQGHPASAANAQSFVAMLEDLSARAGLAAVPRLFIVPSATLVAFSAGTSAQPAIAVSEGLVRKLSLREIAAVLAHEISHVRRGDLALFGLADMLSRLAALLFAIAIPLAILNVPSLLTGLPGFSWLAIGLLFAAPMLMSLAQLQFNRTREYTADDDAAFLTGDPEAVALSIRQQPTYEGAPWEDLIFAMRRVPFPSLLRLHPDAEQRVAALNHHYGQHAEPKPLWPRLTLDDGPMITALAGYGASAMFPRIRWPGVWF